jgi:CheY-like chemotaxis protein
LGEEVVSGRVAWCRHVSGTWHAVGVRFDDPISPKQFVSPAEWDRLPTSNPIKPQSLTGQVLMIDDQDVDQMLFAHLLRSTRLSVTTVGDVARAVEAIGKLVFDVVCLDLNLGVGRPGGEDAIATLRSAGHKGPIVAVSGVQASRLEAARSRGVAHTLAKPYDTEQLIAVLAAALEVNGGEPADPIYSELSHQEGVADLLQAFCDKVRQSMRQFRLHVDAGRLDDVRMVCEMLRGSAGGYGYPSLSAAAGQAIKAIDACGDVAEASPDLLKLIALSKRITPSKKPRATAA